MERQRKEFEKRGVKLAAVSFDPPEVLKAFSERAGIGFALLSDPGSKIIKKFGILNTSVAETHQFYGIPNPGEYLVGADGVIKAKFFEEKYADRYTGGSILVRQLGVTPDGGTETETDHLLIQASASDKVLRGGNRATLVLEIMLKPGMHVYAPGIGGGYIGIDWEMEPAPGLTDYEAEYPASKLLHMAAIAETVPVFEGRLRVVRDVMIGQPKDVEHLLDQQGNLLLKGSFRYQACDDKVCYLPQTVPLEWTFKLEQHDRTRASVGTQGK